MRSEGNVYNPVPERVPKARDADELARIELKSVAHNPSPTNLGTYCGRAIVQACDIRLHRSFLLAPSSSIGRDRSIRVTYSDVGYSAADEKKSTEIPHDYEIPVLLWCGGQFGGRYFAFANDELAKRYKIRFLAIDRPGIGGTEGVPLNQRIATWLDMVQGLLDHVGVKYCHLASHSAGTIFVLNTLLHQRHLLHPTKPYVAMFGPWVAPSDSGKWDLSAVSKLPESWIGKWHHIAKFMNNTVAPVLTASGVAITKASKAPIQAISASKAAVTESAQSKHEEALWKAACESILTRYVFAENVEGASHEALLCLRKGNIRWGNWENTGEAISKIATNEKARMQEQRPNENEKLKIHAFFAENDEMIGKGGQKYFEECFAAPQEQEYIEFRSHVIAGTDHNDVLAVSRGGIQKMMEEIGSSPEEVCRLSGNLEQSC